MEIADRYKRAHMVGIGGVGMAALARLLKAQGMCITGSDLTSSSTLQGLAQDGFTVSEGHSAAQLGDADLLVYSAAIPESNVERLEAEARGIRCASRGEVLGEMSKARRTIAIAGTHGKTTTASMTTNILCKAGWGPDSLVGGEVDGRACTAVGVGEWLVVEADEYARSFHHLHPEVALVTCVEAEHLDCYGGIAEVEKAFVEFLHRLPPEGTVLVGGDDLVGDGVVGQLGRNCLSVGFGEGCDYRIEDLYQESQGSRFSLFYRDLHWAEFEIGVPGLHNVRNAAGAASMAHHMGVDGACCAAGLAGFRGVDRRFELKGDVDGIQVVDDYAHHPSEVAAALQAARVSGRRIIAVFQPHLYTRTRDFKEGFARELARADRVILTDVYPAREKPIQGVDGQLIATALHQRGYDKVDYIANYKDLVPFLSAQCKSGDIVLTMGAGNIGEIAEGLVEFLGGEAR